MATKTFDELKQLAIQIRDEKTNKQNTANRVGTAMLEGINKLEQDYYDKTAADKELKKRDDKLIELANNVGLYNVDKHVPLGGGFYTSATARAAVPSDVRKIGLIITYKTDVTTSVTEQFIGSDVSGWTTDTNWKNVGSEGGNKILEWETDAATTRKKVPVKERKAGMQISYKPTDSDWVNEQYVGTSFTDTEWVKDSNWEKIPKQKQLTELDNNIFNNSENDLSPIVNSGTLFYKIKSGISNNNFSEFTKLETQSYENGYLWFNLSTKTDNTSILLSVKAMCYVGKAKIIIFNPDLNQLRIAKEVSVVDGINIIPCNIQLQKNEYVTITNCFAKNGTKISVQIKSSGDSVTSTNYSGNQEIALIALYEVSEEVVGLNQNNEKLESIENDVKNNTEIIKKTQEQTSKIINTGGIGNVYNDYKKTLSDESYASSWPNKLKADGGNGNIFFNQASLITSNSKLYKVKAKTNSGDILFYKYNNTTKEFSKIATKNASIDGINEFDFSLDDIELKEGDYISCSNVYYKVNAAKDSIQLTFSDDGSSITTTNESASFNLFFEFTTSEEKEIVSLIQLKENQDIISENIKGLMGGVFKTCTLFTDNFSKNNAENWEYSNWTLAENKVTATGYGESSKLKSKRKYFLDKRRMRASLILGNDSIIKIDCTASWNEGASCFGIDIPDRKLIIYKSGSGLDNQFTSQGYTDEELTYSTIEEDIINPNGEYTIELIKDSTNHIFKMINDKSGKYTTVEHDGWGAGRQNEQYGFYAVSGTYPKIKSFGVYGMESPDVVFAGDSQTEGVYVSDRSKRYAELYRTQNIGLKVAISAKGGAKIQDIIDMFNYEYNIIKPKKMSLLIGTNDIIHNTGTEVFEQKLRELKGLCDSINCQLIINRIVCVYVNEKDGHIEYNNIINKVVNELGLCSAKFDHATAIDNIPYVDVSSPSPRYNPVLYGDKGLHPNVNGNADMYERLLIDVPIL